MSISDRLDEIEARADNATEGPWKIETHYGMSQSRRRQIVVPGWMTPIAVLGQENPYGDPDAEFIAHARTDVPALVAALRAVLDLHKAYPDTGMGWREDHTYGYVGTVCGSCGKPDEYGVPWPCPTVRAVTAALGEDS